VPPRGVRWQRRRFRAAAMAASSRRYQHILHRNLIYLATIADATPAGPQKAADWPRLPGRRASRTGRDPQLSGPPWALRRSGPERQEESHPRSYPKNGSVASDALIRLGVSPLPFSRTSGWQPCITYAFPPLHRAVRSAAGTSLVVSPARPAVARGLLRSLCPDAGVWWRGKPSLGHQPDWARQPLPQLWALCCAVSCIIGVMLNKRKMCLVTHSILWIAVTC